MASTPPATSTSRRRTRTACAASTRRRGSSRRSQAPARPPRRARPGPRCSDGSVATSVGLAELGGVALGPDGRVYFSEQCGNESGRVRKIELDGTLTTVVDNLFDPDGLAFAPDGSLYVVDTLDNEVFRLTPSGVLSVVAGGGSTYPGDGGPATQASLGNPADVTVDDDGSFYISDNENCSIRFVDTAGVMHTITEGCGGRITSVTATSAADGTRTWSKHYQYSPDTGFASSSVDAVGQTVSWTRDPVGRPLLTQLPDLPSTTAGQNQVGSTWDKNGNLSTLAVPSTESTAPTHSFPLYSPVDELQTYSPPAITPPLATSDTTYTYNFDGQLTSIQVPENAAPQAVSPGYDSVGRLHTIADSLSGVTSTIEYAPGGLPQSVTTSDGEALTYTYGVDGPLLMAQTWSGSVTGSVSFTHDNFFRVASRAVNSGPSIVYDFDADGLYAGASGLVSYAVTRDFDGQNGLLTGSALGSVTDAITYNGFGELKTYAATFGGSPVYSSAITSRDADGRITGATETLSGTTHTWAFGYDAHGDLDSATEDSTAMDYVFDPNGNRLSAGGQASTYDAQDRLQTSPGATYTYTNNGDLLTKVTSSGTASYSYDLRGALRSITLASGDTVSYVIDGRSRRLGRTWTHGLQKVTQGFLYDDQLHVAAEVDGSGTVVSIFVYGTRINVPDAMVRGGKTYRILSDWRGSVRAVVDANVGTVVETIDYDAWGVATVNDTTCAAGAVCALFQPFGFAGGIFDRETGLTRFGARDYDASVGRWTQKDASGFGGGLNLYRYAKNDPINYMDVTGRNPFVAAAAYGAAFVVGFAAGSWYYFDWSTIGDAEDTGLPGPINGPQDAYRHCLLSCRLASAYGQTLGGAVCESHEVSTDVSPATIMDRYNNSIGLSYAQSGGASCEDQCLAGISENTLQWQTPEGTWAN